MPAEVVEHAVDAKVYDPNQPRDEAGRWSGTGGSAPDRGDGSGAHGTSPSERVRSRPVAAGKSPAESRIGKYASIYQTYEQFSNESLNTPGRNWQQAAENANEIFGRTGGEPQDYEIRTLKLKDVTPNQEGEDYLNDSSRNTAAVLREFNSREIDPAYPDDLLSGVRIEDLNPIAVQSDGTIIDGNHRHAAHKLNKEKEIVAMVAIGKGTGKITNLRQVYEALTAGGKDADATFLATEFRALTKGVRTKIARSLIKAAHQRQYERVERDVAKEMAKFFKAQVRDTTKALFAKDWKPDPENAAAQAKRLVARAFDQDRWDEEIIVAAGQPLADAFIEGAVAEVGLNNAVRTRDRIAFAAYDPGQPRDDAGRWTGTGGSAPDRGDGSGAAGTGGRSDVPVGTTWKNASHKTAAEISGTTPPDTKLVTKKLYHITSHENAAKILEEGFDITKVRPRWQNDYAISLSVGQKGAEQYFSETGQGLDTSKYAVLEVTVKGRYTDETMPIPLGASSSPQDYTKQMVEMGLDGQNLGKTYYVHNPRSIAKIEHVAAKTAKGYNPDQPRDDNGRWGSGDITKAFTKDAEEFDDEYGGDIDFPNELPDWLREASQDYILETFEQDYWLRINITTREDIEGVLYRAIEDGMSIREIAKEIQDRCGPAYSRARATAVARTETSAGMNAGHRAGIERAYEGIDVEPAAEWLSVLGSTTRPTHEEADGQQRPLSEPFIVGGHQCRFPGDFNLPPEERINCQCHRPDNVLVGNVLGGLRAFYSGDMAEVVTGTGARFAVTPNHPVPTANRGMVPAGELKEGDHVLLYRGPIYEPAIGRTASDHEQHEPTTAGEVFQLLLAESALDSVEVRRSLEHDLHGDARFCRGEIEVVLPGRQLRRERQLVPQGQQREVGLTTIDVGLVTLASSGSLSQRGRLSGRFNPSLHSGEVPRTRASSPSRCYTFGPCAEWYSSLYQNRPQSVGADVKILREFLVSLASNVSRDRVVKISISHYEGPVYDFQTRNGTIFANGVLVGNCTILSAFVGEGIYDDEEGGKGYNPDQPRDNAGRWSSTGGGDGPAAAAEASGTGVGFELGQYPQSAALDIPAARAKFDHLNAVAESHRAEAHAHRKLAEAEPDLLKKQEHYKNERAADARHTMARFDMMTYRQANDAADREGYLRGRQKVAETMKSRYEAEEALTQKMLADGVRPKGDASYKMELTPSGVRSAAAYSFKGNADEQFKRAQEEYPGLKREHFDAAVKMEPATFAAADARAEYERPYYGEPEEVRMESKTLGPVDRELMPPNIESGGGPQAVRDFMANGKIAIAVKDKPLDRIITNGEFKNRFEGGIAGVNSSKGRAYKEARLAAENEVFGISYDAEGGERPAYGYIEHPDRLLSSGAEHGSNYGENQIVLKDDLKSRTTFTVGDSIDDRRIRDNAKPSPINDPHLPPAIEDNDHVFYAGRTNDEWKIDAVGSGLGHQKPKYIEAQVFGKIKLEDIAEIRIPRERVLKPAQEKKLAKAGVRVVRVAPAAQISFYTTPKDWDSAYSKEDL